MSEPCRPLVLITRPEPAAHDTARVVAARGYHPVLAPMLTIAAHRLACPKAAQQAILVTSANALPALADFDRDIPVMAVGDATALRATQAGFLHVASAGRDAVALAGLVEQKCTPAGGPLFLASGAGQGTALAAALRQSGFTVRRVVAYGAKPVRALSQEAIDAIEGTTLRHAMFFSSATATAFVACMMGRAGRLGGVEALAISPATARALAPLPWLRIRVASHPNQDELVALLT